MKLLLTYFCLFIILVSFTLKFILTRQFQSDEFLIATSIHMLNFAKESQFIHMLNFYMLPFSYITSFFKETTPMLFFLRSILFSIFLINISLLVRLVTNQYKKSVILFFVLLSHYQLWRFGFEIRHETLIVFFILLSSLAIKKSFEKLNNIPFILSGFFLSLLAFTAYKGFIYSLAMGGSFALLILIRERLKGGRYIFYFTLSYLITSAAQMLIFYLYDLHLVFVKIMGNYVNETYTSMVFSPKGIYFDILRSAPLTVLALCWVFYHFVKRKQFFNFSGWCFLILLHFTILLHLNPAPFRYNIHTYLIVILITILANFSLLPKIRKIFIAPAILIHFGLFIIFYFTDYYMHYSNTHQLEYVQNAEKLTEENEPVFDLIGIVATRPQAHPGWWIYNGKMKSYMEGKIPLVRSMINESRPPVIITNYRWTWLPKTDWEALQKNYVRLHDQFWVLGHMKKTTKGSVKISRSGKYYLISKSPDLKISNFSLDKEVLDLEAGTYEFENNNANFALVWIGEKLSSLPSFISKLNGPWMITPMN
ncbi:MAG: hypothetical protein CME65_07970 [Halobacteriovoraceae bacterium]|nr:hypothetical protein [Halobacteriovoraceae bacterium]